MSKLILPILAVVLLLVVTAGNHLYNRITGLQAEVADAQQDLADIQARHRAALASAETEHRSALNAAEEDFERALALQNDRHTLELQRVVIREEQSCNRQILDALSADPDNPLVVILKKKNQELAEISTRLDVTINKLESTSRELETQRQKIQEQEEAVSSLQTEKVALVSQRDGLRKKNTALEANYRWLSQRNEQERDLCLSRPLRERREKCVERLTVSFDRLREQWVECYEAGVEPDIIAINLREKEPPSHAQVLWEEGRTGYVMMLCDPLLSDRQ